MASCLSACGKEAEIQMPFSDFQIDKEDISVKFSKNDAYAKGFSYDLATFSEDYTDGFRLDNAGAGLLVDVNNKKVLFAQNAFERMYPASLTKIMTAYVALKYCSTDEIDTVTDEVLNIADPTAVKLGLKPGDVLTMDQALHLCLIPSCNDVATAIACHVSGTEAAFCELMNKEAEALGCVSTHFTDSNGLGGEEHYTSVYDLYLIFNEAIKNQDILDIINCKDYSTVYHDKSGNEVPASVKSTNMFFRELYEVPANVNVVGGKTGSTTDAGYCLILYSKDNYSNPYISVILDSDSRENLYLQMTDLLLQITN